VVIQLLGPTQLEPAGSLGPRDRVVLSALCVQPGRAVPAEELADALWGESPPRTWAKVVQGTVVRLRRTLGAGAIQTTQAGYRVVLPEGELDTVEFERLVARGRSFLALHEPERAATTFARALALWRGEPFHELAGWDPARAEAARLLEVRSTVEEDLVEAHLAAGRADDAAARAGPLVAREPFRERRWALLATSLYRSGRQADALAVLRRAARTLRDELGLDPGPQLADLERRMLAQDASLVDVPNRIGGASQTCPYRGLRPFDTEDADFFFGRDRAVAEAIARLDTSPLLVVAGPSGSGKSSLVRAGLLPQLARRGRAAAVLTPGPDPMAALQAAIAGLPDDGVLVVDQLEEAFTGTADREHVRRFLDRVAACAGHGRTVLATVRADHLGWLAESPALADLVERGLLLLTPLTEEELREAVEAPAGLVGLHLEAGLVDVLVRDVAGAPGGLPLLSHALAETWEHREGTVMTVEAYRATGGIHSAIAQSAERLYESLAPPDRDVLRSLLERMVTPTPSGEPVAARVPTRALVGSPEVPRLLDLLIRSRLVTAMGDTATIAHESLVRAWPRLRAWLEEDVEGRRILAHLQAAADSWEGLGRPEDELYRGARLAAAREWQARVHPLLAPGEQAFLAASAARADAERLRVEAAHAHQVRRNRQLVAALLAVAALLGVSVLAGTQAGLRGRQAQAAATRADAAALAARAARLGSTAVAEPNTALSLLLARQAVEMADDPATEGTLLQSLVHAGGLVGLTHPATSPPSPITRDHAFTPDGSRLLRLGGSGDIHLVDTGTGASRWTTAGRSLPNDGDPWMRHPLGLVDGGRVAMVSEPAPGSGVRGVRVLAVSTATGELLGAPQPLPGAVAEGFFNQERPRISADGRTLVSVRQRMVRVWHLRAGRWEPLRPLPLPELDGTFPDQDLTTGVTMSADGTRAAVQLILQAPPFWVGQRVVLVVDTTMPRLVGPLLTSGADGSGIWQSALSPDGRRLLTGDFADGAVQVRDAGTGAPALVIPGDSPASALAWSADGRQVGIGRIDGTREVFTLSPLRRIARYRGSELVMSVGFTSADGLAVQDIGGTIARYDLSTLAPVMRAVPAGRIHEVAVTDSVVALGADDGRIRLHDRATLRRLDEDLWLGPYPDPDPTVAPSAHRRVTALAVLPDGSALLAADRTGHLRMWSLPDRRLLWSRDDVPAAWLAVSPDGRHLATFGFTPSDTLPDGGAASARLVLWDLATRSPVFTDDFADRALGATPPKPRTIAFSPDSATVAVSSYEDVLRVYDVAQRRRLFARSIHASALAFTPEGTRLLGATPGLRRISVWNAQTGESLEAAWAPRLGESSRMRFTDDGRWLLITHDRSLTVLDGRTLRVAVADVPLPNDGTNDAFALAPSTDGHMLVGTQTALVDLDLDPQRWKEASCRLAGRALTTQEWDRYLPEDRYDPACR
jgi:DNA-binding SARP family transcriptional activator/WD40 repeat protein